MSIRKANIVCMTGYRKLHSLLLSVSVISLPSSILKATHNNLLLVVVVIVAQASTRCAKKAPLRKQPSSLILVASAGELNIDKPGMDF